MPSSALHVARTEQRRCSPHEDRARAEALVDDFAVLAVGHLEHEEEVDGDHGDGDAQRPGFDLVAELLADDGLGRFGIEAELLPLGGHGFVLLHGLPGGGRLVCRRIGFGRGTPEQQRRDGVGQQLGPEFGGSSLSSSKFIIIECQDALINIGLCHIDGGSLFSKNELCVLEIRNRLSESFAFFDVVNCPIECRSSKSDTCDCD